MAQGYPLQEIMLTAAAALGRRPTFVRVPSELVLAAGALGGLIGGSGGQPAFFTLGKARELLHPDWSVRPEDLPPDAPACRFDLSQGWADSVAWWRGQGRL